MVLSTDEDMIGSWHDADTVLLNRHTPLSLFLPLSSKPQLSRINLILTRDPHGLNNGVFFLRIHPWSVDLLAAVLAYPTFNADVALEYRDQSALIEVLKIPVFKEGYVVVPQRWFNAYQPLPPLDTPGVAPDSAFNDDGLLVSASSADSLTHLNYTYESMQFHPGDLLVHFAGVPNRDERMRVWLGIARRNFPQFNVPVEETNLAAEVEAWWVKQALVVEQRSGG